jgi:hypothetical protein
MLVVFVLGSIIKVSKQVRGLFQLFKRSSNVIGAKMNWTTERCRTKYIMNVPFK